MIYGPSLCIRSIFSRLIVATYLPPTRQRATYWAQKSVIGLKDSHGFGWRLPMGVLTVSGSEQQCNQRTIDMRQCVDAISRK